MSEESVQQIEPRTREAVCADCGQPVEEGAERCEPCRLRQKIDSLPVDEIWKNTFRRLAAGKKLVCPCVFVLVFGLLGYLALGMYGRFLLYALLYAAVVAVEVWCDTHFGSIEVFSYVNMALALLLSFLAPYDYYRVKVLGKIL